MQRWELRLYLSPLRLEPRREHEMLAERRRIFIDCKSGPVGGNLEEHPTRLEEINRFEPEAVDDFGGAAPRPLDSLAYLQLCVDVGYPPRDVMNAAGPPTTTIGVRDLLNLQVAARRSTVDAERGPLFLLTEIHKAEDPR